MIIGKYFNSNQKKIAHLTDNDWRVSLKKCKSHIEIRLRQKTLSGAHTASNLGMNPTEHYLGIAYEKLLSGNWEWKDEYTLSEQMIRIVDSYISKEVDKAKTSKSMNGKIIYKDIEADLFDLSDTPIESGGELKNQADIQLIEEAVKGDAQLEFFFEAVKEGKKRSEIADLLEITPRQLDKLREKVIRKVRSLQSIPVI